MNSGYRKIINSPYVHPVLFAVFPIFFLYVHNHGETPLTEIGVPLAAALALTLGGLLVLRPLLRDRIKRSLVLTAFMVLFFSYGHMVYLLRDFQVTLFSVAVGPNSLVAVCWSVALSLITYLFLRARHPFRQTTVLVNGVALVMVATQVVWGIGLLISQKSLTEIPSPAVSSHTAGGTTPDIYYIILDGYGRSDVLREMYGYDNTDFLTYLRDTGFHVADSSSSNYCQTLLSLGSTLNLDYVQQLRAFDAESSDRRPLIELLQHNAVFDMLRSHGYSLIAFSTGVSATEFEDVDVRLTPGVTFNEFQNILLASTPLPLLFHWGKTQYDFHRDRLKYILHKLPRISEGSSPRFVIAHLIAPHPPFVLGRDGSPVARSRRFNFTDGSSYFEEGGKLEEYHTGYVNQVTYLNYRLRGVIDTILANSHENPPIIVLQADHGPGSELDWGRLDATNVKERFSILNAYYLPGIARPVIRPTITPVNTYRLLFNLYFGTDYDELPDKQYYSQIHRPFELIEVTNRARPRPLIPKLLKRPH